LNLLILFEVKVSKPLSFVEDPDSFGREGVGGEVRPSKYLKALIGQKKK
jgi:hypothetical protein